jgi:predicted enzyme related to lactoylglutathione lyase
MPAPDTATPLVTGVDFVSVPTRDLARAVAFYGKTLGLPMSVHHPDHGFAEFETGDVTLSVVDPERMGVGEFQATSSHLALQVPDVGAARTTLEERGVTFAGDTLDTGVCHMAIFADPDGNALMLHHRYAPRVTEA